MNKFTDQDRAYMQMAIREAALDQRLFKVGAAIVKGEDITCAHGRKEDGQHAELTAIQKSLDTGKDLIGATLYSTLEPCVPDARHPRRQPCAVEILNQPIRRVVIGVLDPNPQVRNRGIRMLQSPTLEVVLCSDYDLQRQIKELNKEFFELEWPRFLDFPGFSLDKNFQGRIKERGELTDWVCRRGRDGGFSIITLLAIGGMGKSNLTWLWAKHDVAGEEIAGRPKDSKEIASRCRVQEGWQKPLRIMWFSFYQYEGGGDFNKFLEEAIAHFSAGIRTREDYLFKGQVNYPHLMDDLINILRQQRSLIVWDGAERLLVEYSKAGSILKDECTPIRIPPYKETLRCTELRVAQFLWQIASQTKCKLLLASRLPFSDLENRAGAAHMELGGLDPESAVRFLKDRGIKGPDVFIEEKARWYEFHPQSLSNLAASLQNDFEYTANIAGVGPDDPGIPPDQRRTHILELAYEKRAPHRQKLLSRMAAIRGTISKEMIMALAKDIPGLEMSDLGSDLAELIRHRLLRKSPKREGTYDFHPLIRPYAYIRLKDKISIHSLLAEYFRPLATDTNLAKARNLEDLSPLIELYHHTAKSGQYDAALILYKEQRRQGKTLNELLFYELCEFHTVIELLEELFEKGLDQLPNVAISLQGSVLNDIALAYSNLGQLRRAISMLERMITVNENIAVLASTPEFPKSSFLSTLGTLSVQKAIKDQNALCLENMSKINLELGNVKTAHEQLKKSMKLYWQVPNPLGVAIVKGYCGQLFGYMGQFKKAYRYLKEASTFFKEKGEIEHEFGTTATLADLALLRHDPARALKYAVGMREKLKYIHNIRATVLTEYSLGAAKLALDKFDESSIRLEKALAACRRIKLMRSEARILLKYAELSLFRANNDGEKSEVVSLREKAEETALEALNIAERCGYRLQQAEIHNFLARLYNGLDKLQKAREHAEIAKELATCGVDPTISPYYYLPAYKEAEQLLS